MINRQLTVDQEKSLIFDLCKYGDVRPCSWFCKKYDIEAWSFGRSKDILFYMSKADAPITAGMTRKHEYLDEVRATNAKNTLIVRAYLTDLIGKTGFNNHEIAELLGCSSSYITNVLNGKCNVGKRGLKKFTEFFEKFERSSKNDTYTENEA